MASRATITLILLGKLSQRSLAVPAGDTILGVESLSSISLAEGGQHSIPLSRSSVEQPRTTMIDVETLLLSPLYEPSSTPPGQKTKTSDSFSYSKSQSTGSSAPYTKTVTITEDVPTTITVTASPVTITETLFSSQPVSTSHSPSQTSTAGLGPAKSIWLPTKLSDLSVFHVSTFMGGEENLKFVDGIPEEARNKDEISSDESSLNSLLQLFFPAGSINPNKKPQGGAEFYASPINITSARNVTLQYSVYFPLNFDFVLAGKMPGLYGGHTGCSGGDPATDCFSTRLMWRQDGAGELYLVSFCRVLIKKKKLTATAKYAPKKRQSDELCKANGSVCDEAYGFSIGRGAFSWKAGDWTTIRQTVFLNTPGKQDGIFTLDVDGKRAITRNDILYRDNLREAKKDIGEGKAVKQKTTTKHTKTKQPTVTTTATKKPNSNDDGGLLGLGPLLSGLLGGQQRKVDRALVASSTDEDSSSPPSLTLVPRAPFPPQIQESSSKNLEHEVDFEIESTEGADVTFVGIFFRFVCGISTEVDSPDNDS